MWRSDSAPTFNQPFMLHPSHGISDPTIELSQAFQESSLDIPTYARFDPWASISSQASVPMQPSASLPVYLAPPDSNDIEMPFPLADAAAMDDARFLEAFFRVPSPAIPAPAVPHPLPEQPLLRPPDTLDAEVPAMSTTSSSTGSTASTAPTEGSAFSASTPKASTLLGDSPPPAGMPDKAKAHREQELFSQLLGAKTRCVGLLPSVSPESGSDLTRYRHPQVHWLLLIAPLPFIRVHTGPPSFTPLHYSSIISFSVPPALVALRRILTL